MWSVPRSRARFNRVCPRRALASLSSTAMLFLQRGALCATDSASRISPLCFDGDERGRVRQFYEAVAFDQKFLWSDASLRLLAELTTVTTRSAFS